MQGICESNTPDQAKIVLVDLRRTMLGEVQSEHLSGYATTAPNLAKMLNELVSLLGKRFPGENVTPQQLRDRSWWTGPEVYVVIDDYDLVVTTSENPVAAVRELLPHGRDIGFHLIIARRSGGAGRALYEPVLASLRDLGSTGLIMSGSRDEGALLASIKPTPMPPGRGMLVDRRRAELIQTAWTPPPE
ncbi:hypothetical protein [Nocardia jiangxiensis]|uniref:hypothetical protein n=1 Tax=Nocardia jiangxiensis TaxID=282685 RepID=UPI0002E92E2B|nr:hypothetical protein [Nocardia jiangxiensis]